MRPVCVLIGPPGAGKSTVGHAVAQRLAVEFRDTDADVEQRAGKPISDIFIDDGEQQFRGMEAEAVARALAECSGVVALGGGAIIAEPIREALAGHAVVYLSVDVGDAVKRVGLGAGRPLVAMNPRAALRSLLEQRRPWYEQVATFTVSTTGRTVDQVADEILAALPMAPQESGP